MNIAYPEPMPEPADLEDPPQPKPSAAPPVQVLEDAELYKYKYLRERAQTLQLIAEKHSVMAQKALQDCNAIGAELGKHLDALAAKYEVNLHVYMITEDGQIVPIPSVQR